MPCLVGQSEIVENLDLDCSVSGKWKSADVSSQVVASGEKVEDPPEDRNSQNNSKNQSAWEKRRYTYFQIHTHYWLLLLPLWETIFFFNL